MNDTSAELLARFERGDERAADEIFRRYVERLTLLARTRLSSKLASRTDPEDIVLSAYRSFFVGARRGQFSLHRCGDLWRLLASITMHKLYRQAKHHTAEMRSVDAEERDVHDTNRAPQSGEPSPAEIVGVADTLESMMSRLDPLGRRVLELRLQGERIADIAAETGSSERTVRRTLQQIRHLLSDQLND